MDCLRDLMATLTNQMLLVMVGSYPRHKRATIPRQTRAPPTISLCHCPQNTTAGRVWLYTLLYGNSLYRLYATAIHRYTSFTPRPGSPVTLYSIYSVYSYTAIHAIQHTALYSLPQKNTTVLPAASCQAVCGRGEEPTGQGIPTHAGYASVLCAVRPARAARECCRHPDRDPAAGPDRFLFPSLHPHAVLVSFSQARFECAPRRLAPCGAPSSIGTRVARQPKLSSSLPH